MCSRMESVIQASLKAFKAVTFYGPQWERETFPTEWKVSECLPGVAAEPGCRETDCVCDGGTKRHLARWSVGNDSGHTARLGEPESSRSKPTFKLISINLFLPFKNY